LGSALGKKPEVIREIGGDHVGGRARRREIEKRERGKKEKRQ
jgi:hypothetical protein